MFERKATNGLAYAEGRHAIKNILIIDDNCLVSRYLQIKLQIAGYQVTVLESVGQAEASTGGTKTEVVALASPGLPSVQQAITRLRMALNCPVIVYGINYDTAEERESAGADCWIQSFHDSEDLVKAVEKACANKAD